MDKSTHQIRCEQWLKIINDCTQSGMNKTAWCKEKGISDKSFFYWQRILRNEAYIEALETSSVSLTPVQQQDNKIDFVEIKTSATVSSDNQQFKPDIIIRQGNTAIEISNSAAPALLQILGGYFNAQ